MNEQADAVSRSASLLELDWRFLLPPAPEGGFERAILLGADTAVAEQARAAGFARDVCLDAGAQGAGAVICLARAGVTLEEAAARVATRGVLYYEAERGREWPFGASPERLRRSLRRLGLSQVALYSVHPRFSGPRTYFPLDTPHALAWYLGSLQIRASVAGETARFVLGRLARRPTILGRLAPHVAVVAVAGVRRDRSRFALASRELPEALRQHELTPLVLVHGDERSRVVALPFASSARQPLAVVKFYRQPPADAAADEQAVLEAIRQRVGERLRATIPQPLGVLRTGSVVATAETFLPGEWLHARWQRRNLPLSDLREDLELVAEWLTDFHLESRVETRRWTENDVERWLEHPLTGYERAFGPTEAESRLFTEARRRARDVRGVPIPVVWQHRDFSSLNILRAGGSIHVVDWEGASLGPPLDDLLYFATRWLHRARHSTRADAALAFRQLLLDPRYRDPAVDAVRGVISRYARALDIDGRLLPLLLLEPWLRRALGRLGRQGTPRWPAPSGKRGAGRVPQAAAAADPRLGNRYVEYVEALAEAPEALFAYSA